MVAILRLPTMFPDSRIMAAEPVASSEFTSGVRGSCAREVIE